MFSEEQLQGIVLSLAKPEIHISRDSRLNIGYKVRLRLNFRGAEEFLLLLSNSLEYNQINSTYKNEEHKTRPRPILRISGVSNLSKLIMFLPELPDARNEFSKFKRILALVMAGAHHTQEGLDTILDIKGEI